MQLCKLCGNFTFGAFVHEYSTSDSDGLTEWMRCKVCDNIIEMDEFVKGTAEEKRDEKTGSKAAAPKRSADDDSGESPATREIPHSFSQQEMRKLQEQVYVLSCHNCGSNDHSNFSYICDETDGSILCRYCEMCNSYFGADDSMGLNQLFELLQQGMLKTTKCSCGNDEVEKFIFDEVEENGVKSVVLRCSVCQNKTDVVNEDDIDLTGAFNDDTDQTAFDNQDDVMANLLKQMQKTKELKEQSTCHCETEDPSHFNVYLDMFGCLSKVECSNCGQEYVQMKDKPIYHHGDDLTPTARTRMQELSDLRPGDHIAWHQPLGYWHHAVIVDLQSAASKLLVIEYSGPVKAGPPKFVGGVIVEHWILLNLAKEELYRIEYKNSNSPDVVIAKARTRLGEARYNLLTNNCEHFARWCKTNHHRSIQVESFTDTLKRWGKASFGFATKYVFKSASKYLAKDVAPRVVAFDALQMGNLALAGGEVCATEMGGGLSKTCSQASTALGWAGMGTLIAIEGISCVRDIREAEAQKDRGELDRREFLNVVVKRVAQGAGGVAGTAAGGGIGQAVIPLPVVGGLVGSTLGYFLGQALGALVGKSSVKAIEAIPEIKRAVKYVT